MSPVMELLIVVYEEGLNFDLLDLTCVINEPEAEQKIPSVYIERGTQTIKSL